ncbi:MAG: hypothetical protein J7647_17320 [Cyanobacteria bacterium SBLK]|nr:hypothetical protein [Cyanobacteria bacterium SBLK]
MTRSPQTPQNKHLTCLPGGNYPTRKPATFPIPKPPKNAIANIEGANPEEFTTNLQQLEEKAIKIHQLSTELATAIAEFQEIGDRVDRGSIHFRKNLGHHWFPERICSYEDVKVPHLHQTEKGVLVLSSHRVRLKNKQHFTVPQEARKEANSLANLLRQRNKVKP